MIIFCKRPCKKGKIHYCNFCDFYVERKNDHQCQLSEDHHNINARGILDGDNIDGDNIDGDFCFVELMNFLRN